MGSSSSSIRAVEGLKAATCTADALGHEPLLLKGFAGDWPAVGAAKRSDADFVAYASSFYRDTPVELFIGDASIGGRFFYSGDMAGFNFKRQPSRLTDVLQYLLAEADNPAAPSIYIGAAPVPEHLPGFEVDNAFPLAAQKFAVPRIWIGNRTTVTTHFDTSDNVACVVAGRRRFTLFPPDQVANLYVGPLDHTMAGQPASMVDLHDPDHDRFPRFREALAAARTAELEPGDAIYVPTLWWHQVDALSPFNALVNYWWNPGPLDAGSPYEALAHGLLAISHLPAERREAWRAMFDQYVFQRNGDPAAHIPVEKRGILGPPSPELRARMRAFLLRALGQQP